MSEELETEEDPNAGLSVVDTEEENKLLSDEYEKNLDIVESLYIPKNLGGRVNFMKKQPALAARIFGEDLMKLDQDGTDDRKARAMLEKEAALRHDEFINLVKNLEKNAMKKNELQVEYLDGVVKDLGREIALMFLHNRFVDKIFPPPPEEFAKEAPPEEVEPPIEREESGQEKDKNAKQKKGFLGSLKDKVKDTKSDLEQTIDEQKSGETPPTKPEEPLEQPEQEKVEANEALKEPEVEDVEEIVEEAKQESQQEPIPEEPLAEEVPAKEQSEEASKEEHLEEQHQEKQGIPKTFAPAMPEPEEGESESGPTPTPGIEISSPAIGGKPVIGGDDNNKDEDNKDN